MALIAVCALLVAGGVAAVVRWGSGPPAPSGSGWRLVRYGAIMAAAGLVGGLLAAGAGGRLAMRLLAVTSPGMQGQFTEAGQEIGVITLGGTVGFMVFAGLTSGLLTGGLYALAYPLLPRGRTGGLLLGAGVLVLAGAQIEPLRSDNFDFALVGPDWLAVLLFAALALLQGMVVVAVAGRLAGGAPLLPDGVRRLTTAGRVAAGLVVLALLPAFAGAVSEILTAS
jgi:hypothetical protein